jgi:phosphoglycolate phosphatase-like HAD superfamily hydrolase
MDRGAEVSGIVVVDFAGTLVKAEVIEEANKFRASILKRGLPTKGEHAIPESLYKVNREFVERLTGITKGMVISYRENDLDFISLSGEQCQNQIATNLFQIGMYLAAKKHGKDIVSEGLVRQLQRIRKLGYKLAIVSGVRQDIISGVLEIAKVPVKFDYIYGQPPVLGADEAKDMRLLRKHGSIKYVLGDKISDLERARSVGAKTIFVRWGHPAGGEEGFADYSINLPQELERIVK